MKGMFKMLLAPMIIMGLNQLGLDYTNPDVLLYSRIGFIAVQLLCLAAYAYVMWHAGRINDQTLVTVKKKPSPFAAAAAAAASSGDDATAAAAPTVEKVPVAQYDSDAARAPIKNVPVGVAITGFIHYKWGYVPPLIIQAVMNPISLVTHPLFSIHFLGKAARGDLKRPFAEENPASMFGLGGADEKKDGDDGDADATTASEEIVVKGSSTTTSPSTNGSGAAAAPRPSKQHHHSKKGKKH